MTIHFDDHVSTLQTCVVCGAAGLDLLHDRAMEIAGRLQLVAQLRSHVGKTETPARLAVAVAADFLAWMVAAAHFFQSDGHVYILAITQDSQLDARTWLLLSNLDLKLAGIADLLAVEFDDDVSHFQTSLRRGRAVFDLGDYGTFI